MLPEATPPPAWDLPVPPRAPGSAWLLHPLKLPPKGTQCGAAHHHPVHALLQHVAMGAPRHGQDMNMGKGRGRPEKEKQYPTSPAPSSLSSGTRINNMGEDEQARRLWHARAASPGGPACSPEARLARSSPAQGQALLSTISS